jgi:hypothetical protein
MSQLGRISGPLLESNLNRNGIDLTFRNYGTSDDLLYLEVTGGKLGINKTPITQKLEVNGTTRTTNLIAPTSADIATITATSNTFSTDIVSPIVIAPNQSNPLVLFDNLRSGNLDFKDNIIKNYTTNGSITFDPNGTGIVDIQSNTTVNGDLSVTGNFQIDGNLTEAENIIVGDTPLDTVTVVPDFTQSLIPGTHLTYDLGKSNKRWKNVSVHDNSTIGSLSYSSFTISEQLHADGPTATITTLQSNDPVLLNPVTGITDVERIRFQNDTITNLDSTALTLASTGIGYVRFLGTNGVIIPAGPDTERNLTPEVGDTRWNNTNPLDNFLECFDGTTWNLATGAGGSISTVENYDLANAYILILG